MNDTRDILRRGLGDYEEPADGFERVLRGRDRRRRNQRIAAGAAAAAIVATGSFAFFRVWRTEPPTMDDRPPPVSVIPSMGAVAYSAVPRGAADPSESPDNPGDIYLSVPGEEPRRILGADGDRLDQSCPTFSPDGMRLAYLEGPYDTMSMGGIGVGTKLLVVDLDDEGIPSADPIEVVADRSGRIASCPKWSPDGSRLATGSAHGMRVATPGAGSYEITFGQFEDDSTRRALLEFEWSPDGTTLAVLDPNNELWLLPTDADREPSLLFPETPSKRTYLFGMAWSPDGERLAVGRGVGSVHCCECCDGPPFLAIVSVRTGSVERVPLDQVASGEPGSVLAWLPHDDLIFLAGGGGTRPALLDPASGSVTELQVDHLIDSPIQWSEDERWFLYVAYDRSRYEENDGNGYAVVAEPIDGSRPAVQFSPWAFSLLSTHDISWRRIAP